MIGKDFISSKVNALLEQSSKTNGQLKAPVDPTMLAPFCKVLSVEPRPMVPEGVLVAVQGGFRIYFQSNFEHQRRMKLRQRFTIAHELTHTFYYDWNDEMPKPAKRSPTGQKLELLCHMGASQILMPKPLVNEIVEKRGEPASAEYIIDLAGTFEVSAEVAIRRLHELRLIPEEKFAAVLVDTATEGRRIIRTACYGPSLLCYADAPKQGMDFTDWLRPLQAPSSTSEDSEWIHSNQSGAISAKKVYISDRSFILELKFGRATQHLRSTIDLWDTSR
jgi:uncharacterized protein DUF955